jgi:hypothetical protein
LEPRKRPRSSPTLALTEPQLLTCDGPPSTGHGTGVTRFRASDVPASTARGLTLAMGSTTQSRLDLHPRSEETNRSVLRRGRFDDPGSDAFRIVLGLGPHAARQAAVKYRSLRWTELGYRENLRSGSSAIATSVLSRPYRSQATRSGTSRHLQAVGEVAWWRSASGRGSSRKGRDERGLHLGERWNLRTQVAHQIERGARRDFRQKLTEPNQMADWTVIVQPMRRAIVSEWLVAVSRGQHFTVVLPTCNAVQAGASRHDRHISCDDERDQTVSHTRNHGMDPRPDSPTMRLGI